MKKQFPHLRSSIVLGILFDSVFSVPSGTQTVNIIFLYFSSKEEWELVACKGWREERFHWGAVL